MRGEATGAAIGAADYGCVKQCRTQPAWQQLSGNRFTLAGVEQLEAFGYSIP
jgi:hypothetical protein